MVNRRRYLIPLAALLAMLASGFYAAHSRPQTPEQGSVPTSTPSPVLTATATLTDTPTSTPTATPQITSTPLFVPVTPEVAPPVGVAVLGVGDALGPMPCPDGMNVWSAGLINRYPWALDKLPACTTAIRIRHLADTADVSADLDGRPLYDWSAADRALDLVTHTPGGRSYQPQIVLDTAVTGTLDYAAWQGKATDLLTHLAGRYGALLDGMLVEGGNEEPPGRALNLYDADAAAVNAAEPQGAGWRLCGPSAVRDDFAAVQRWLGHVTDKKRLVRADGLCAHYYELGASGVDVPLGTAMATWQGLQNAAGTHLPVYVTEFNLDGQGADAAWVAAHPGQPARLITAYDAAWAIAQLADDSAVGVAGWTWAAGVGQGYTSTHGLIGLVALDGTRATYPVGTALELLAGMHSPRRAVSVGGNLPGFSGVSALTDGARWLLANTGDATVTVTVPCTAALRVARVDSDHGNSYAAWRDYWAAHGADGQFVAARSGQVDGVLASPWNDSAGTAIPPIGCEDGRGLVTVSGLGVAYVGPVVLQ